MYDIIFISYNEPNADKNWQALRSRFPTAQRIDGVKGIHNAHKKAAEVSLTKMFWVVDADAVILPEFNFEYSDAYKDINYDTVYVCKSKNPINNLVYGYGGVKLLPKALTQVIDTNSFDMTTSISEKFVPLPEVSNITEFNTDPFNTWKSAFRECAKLASQAIDRQDNLETSSRLETWITVNNGSEFGNYATLGAKQGKEFGENNRADISSINDFAWLKNRFDQQEKI